MKRQQELQAVAGELQQQRNLMVRCSLISARTSLLSHALQGKGKKKKVGCAGKGSGSKQYKWKQERKK